MAKDKKFSKELILLVVGGLVTVATSIAGGYFSGVGGAGNKIDSSGVALQLLEDQLTQSGQIVDQLEDELQEIERSIPHVQRVQLSPRFQVEEESWLARAFLETGNDNANVLATLRDNQKLGDHVVSLWASARTRSSDNAEGVLITVVTSSESFEELKNEQYEIVLNVYQQGTPEERYGEPDYWQAN